MHTHTRTHKRARLFFTQHTTLSTLTISPSSEVLVMLFNTSRIWNALLGVGFERGKFIMELATS